MLQLDPCTQTHAPIHTYTSRYKSKQKPLYLGHRGAVVDVLTLKVMISSQESGDSNSTEGKIFVLM